MTTVHPKRDYSLLGPSSRDAVAKGLMAAEWYHTDVPRKTMKELMKRSDRSGHPRYHHLARQHGRVRRIGRCALGKLVVRAVLSGLWRPLWFGHELALA